MLLFQLIKEPLYQAALCLVLTIGVTGILKRKTADTIWLIAGLMYAFFIVTNAVLSFFIGNTWSYFFISLGISLFYLVVIAFLVNVLIKTIKLNGSEESAMVFLVIIFHPVILLLSFFVKWVFLKNF